MCRSLSRLFARRYQITFEPQNAQIHCLAHVVNLVVQKILFVAKEVDEDPDKIDYYSTFLKHFPVHFEADSDDDEEGDPQDTVYVSPSLHLVKHFSDFHTLI